MAPMVCFLGFSLTSRNSEFCFLFSCCSAALARVASATWPLADPALSLIAFGTAQSRRIPRFHSRNDIDRPRRTDTRVGDKLQTRLWLCTRWVGAFAIAPHGSRRSPMTVRLLRGLVALWRSDVPFAFKAAALCDSPRCSRRLIAISTTSPCWRWRSRFSIATARFDSVERWRHRLACCLLHRGFVVGQRPNRALAGVDDDRSSLVARRARG